MAACSSSKTRWAATIATVAGRVVIPSSSRRRATMTTSREVRSTSSLAALGTVALPKATTTRSTATSTRATPSRASTAVAGHRLGKASHIRAQAAEATKMLARLRSRVVLHRKTSDRLDLEHLRLRRERIRLREVTGHKASASSLKRATLHSRHRRGLLLKGKAVMDRRMGPWFLLAEGQIQPNAPRSV